MESLGISAEPSTSVTKTESYCTSATNQGTNQKIEENCATDELQLSDLDDEEINRLFVVTFAL